MVNSFAPTWSIWKINPCDATDLDPYPDLVDHVCRLQQPGYVIPDDALVIRGGTIQLSDLRKNAQTTLETMSRLGVSAL
jgi:hypothetical protein